jgi:plasmid stabilization system protein ParE
MQIIIPHNVELRLVAILENIENNFGILISQEVESQIRAAIDNLATLPYAWNEVRTKSNISVRKIVINRRTLIFYVIEEERDRIRIVDIVESKTDWK